MLKKIVIGLVSVVAVFAIIVSLQPAEYGLERSLMISATPQQVFPHVNDFEAFNAWSPWSDLDADMTTTYGDITVGEGAVYEWSGDDKVGTGRMTITKSVANTLVAQDLEFIEPFPSSATTEMRLAAVGDKTNVTWSMSGNNDFMGKAFGLFVSMDEMVGGDYEKGLKRLQTVVEADAKKQAAAASAPVVVDSNGAAHTADAAAAALVKAARDAALDAQRDPNRKAVPGPNSADAPVTH